MEVLVLVLVLRCKVLVLVLVLTKKSYLQDCVFVLNVLILLVNKQVTTDQPVKILFQQRL